MMLEKFKKIIQRMNGEIFYKFNNLQPYIYDLEVNPFSNILENSEERKINKESYLKIINEKINQKKFIELSPLLEKIYEDAKKINDILIPLKELGLSYTLDLTGGSCRDLILGNETKIKDLDFMLSIESTIDNRNNVNIYLNKNEWQNNLSKEEIDKYNLSPEDLEKNYYVDKLRYIKSSLVSICLDRYNKNYQKFNKERIVPLGMASDYVMNDTRNDRLVSVFKLNKMGNNTHYDIDILLTDFNKPDFLKDFDFDICKASICFVNKHVEKDFPKNKYELIERFVASVDFWKDIVYKKITYMAKGRSEYEIDRSFNGHYQRIKEKYPDFELNLVGPEESLKYIRKILLVEKLEKDLDQKRKVVKKTKI